MKKATLNTILSLISTIDTPEAEAVRTELNAELNRGKAKAEANRQMYAEMRDPVLNAIRIAGTPVTVKDIAAETSLSQSKISWALRELWADDVNADRSGKVITYTLR